MVCKTIKENEIHVETSCTLDKRFFILRLLIYRLSNFYNN